MTSEKRYVTYVYEIIDQEAWEKAGNPFKQEPKNGLKINTVGAGDALVNRDRVLAYLEQCERFYSDGEGQDPSASDIRDILNDRGE